MKTREKKTRENLREQLTRRVLRDLANDLSDKLADELGHTGSWEEFIDELPVKQKRKALAMSRLRWTIIDEDTGEDLLNPVKP